MANYLLRGEILSAFTIQPVFFVSVIYLAILNIVFIINSFRQKDITITRWIYPKLPHLIVFIISLIVFTIVRNVV